MVALDLGHQHINDLLQGLHLSGKGQVIAREGPGGHLQDLPQGGEKGMELLLGRAGEEDILFRHLLGGLQDVHRVVADALEVADGVQLLGDVPAVLVGEGLAAQLYQQSAQLVLVLVQMVLVGAHPLGVLLVELVQQGEGAEDGILRQTGHLHGLAAALGNGHGGGGQQAGVDEGERGLAPLALLDHQIGQLFQLLGEGQEQDGGGDIEEAVDHSDPAGIDQGVHEGIVDEEAAAVEDQQARRRAAQVEENVDDGNPPGAAVDADTGEQGGGAGADILPHDDGQGHAVGDGAGHGEGLQDAHRGGGGLEHGGKGCAHRHAHEGVCEGGKDGGELRRLRQGAHGVLHHHRAVHQDGESHHDSAHAVAASALVHGAEDDADEGYHGGEVLRLKELEEEGVAVDAREGQDPGRQGGAHVGAHDDAQGLSQLHDTGVDQAHQHDCHGGGRLHGDGDARAQEEAFDRVAGHLLEELLQFAAGQLLQAGGEDRHAIEKERQSPAEGEEGENIHRGLLICLCKSQTIPQYGSLTEKCKFDKGVFGNLMIC